MYVYWVSPPCETKRGDCASSVWHTKTSTDWSPSTNQRSVSLAPNGSEQTALQPAVSWICVRTPFFSAVAQRQPRNNIGEWVARGRIDAAQYALSAPLAPTAQTAFHSELYWNQRYADHTEFFDWYGQLGNFESLVLNKVEAHFEILIIGAGTSRLPFQLYDMGFKHITAIDYAENARKAVAVALETRPGITYIVADIETFEPGKQYDLIIDKGCIDCVLANPCEPLEHLRTILLNMKSLLKFSSIWCSISFDPEREDAIRDALDQFKIEQQTFQVPLHATQETKEFYLYRIQKK